MTLAFLRVAIAAVVLTVFLHIWGERLPASGSIWSAFFAMGLLNNVLPFTLILAGQQHIASGGRVDPQCGDAALHRRACAFPHP